MNYDFDRLVERRGTGSVKYDTAFAHGKPADLLPLWIADMDIPSPPEVTAALQQVVARGLFGYCETDDRYAQAVCGWMQRRHGWQTQPEWLIITGGVLSALAIALHAFTKENDAVMVQPPVYPPFAEKVLANRRRLVLNPLVEEDLHYSIDFADMERKMANEQVKLLILCSPHNPVGRVWTKEELCRIGELCERYDVLVLSDEIHCDFVFDGHKHHMLASLDDRFAARTITCTAPSKTFNLSGLYTSNIFVPNEKLRTTFAASVVALGGGKVTQLGCEACRAAYTLGEPWLEELLNYLHGNLCYVADYLRENIPGVRAMVPQGGYLMWLDLRGLGMEDDRLDAFITDKAKLWLNRGDSFGVGGSGFMRLNPAVPRATLETALARLADAVHNTLIPTPH